MAKKVVSEGTPKPGGNPKQSGTTKPGGRPVIKK
jgi:hypothetical protein